MKGIRHIGKIQLKSSVARFAHKQSSHNLRPTLPPRLSVRASTILIDVLAAPHDDGCQSSADTSHDAPLPDPTSRTKRRVDPLLERIPRPKAIPTGARGTASRAAQKARARVNSGAAEAARGGTTSRNPSWELKTEEMGPVPDLPVVTFTPADGGDPSGSSSGVTTPEGKNELSGGYSDPPRRETRPTALRRSISSPSFKHTSSKSWEQSPPPPTPLPLHSVHIARLRTGSRPAPIPLPPLLATGRSPKIHTTTHAATKLVAPTALPSRPRAPAGLYSTRDGQGSSAPPSNLTRSRSQPQLRTAAIVASAKRSAAIAPADSSRSRAGSPSSTLTLAEGTPSHLQQSPMPIRPAASTGSVAEMPEVLLEAPPERTSSLRWEGVREEHSPRIVPVAGHVAWPMAPVVVMDSRAVSEMRREMDAAVARKQATRRRMYGPR